MLHLLDESLAAFLRQIVPLPAREIDIAFEAPDKEWSAKLSRPTVSLFLWDVRPNLAERSIGLQVVRDEDGKARRQGPMPRIECRYLITAWTTEVGDEHALLGQVLAALLLNPILAPEHLKPPLISDPLPEILLRAGGDTESSDFWSAIGGQLKPGLDVSVSVTLDAAALLAAGPPVQVVLPTVVDQDVVNVPPATQD
jgi:hypothetical protein